ncbi:MAG: B12-binding domain-containing radical SAM protein [Coriobacteriales bacterium]|jgi:radical SAM superfamily enzyme YgiQ (UPF0313 family)|nr:B12-binding domain-containing radical SAM protein [Coriobacteriales bacterium]
MTVKILFLNLPYSFAISRASRWPEKTKSGTLYYPYWLCYAAGVCIEQGYDVALTDCITRKLTVEQTLDLVRREAPDYLMAEITTSTLEYDYQTLTRIREQFPSLRLIVGGTHATVLSQRVLEECPAIDVVVRQEYDFTINEVVQNWGDLSVVAGVTFRDARSQIHQTPDRPWLQDLDTLPFVSKVYQRFLDPNDYFYAFAQKPMIQIVSARGCPFKCNFCSYPQSMSGHRFRRRSVKNFVDELEYIHRQMPAIREIFIEDDTFTVDKKRVMEICDEILARGLSVVWSCNARADLPYEVMKKMQQAGCRLLVVGYESGNQRVLDETQKGIQLADSLAFARNTKKLGLKVFGCFMIGLKGDDLATIEDTFRFAKKTYANEVFFQQAVPFPGTSFYQWVKDENYLRTEDYSQWLNKDGYLNCLVDYPYANAKEIEKLRDRLMSRYYFSFTYMVKTFLANLTWTEFKRVMKAGSTYIWFRVRKAFR